VKLKWEIDDESLGRWRDFINANIGNKFVLEREAKNIARESLDISRDKPWYTFVGCQITTQQRSGPNSKVSIFLNSESPALKYKECLKEKDKVQFIQDELSKAGLRMVNKIASQLSEIVDYLESGHWEELETQLNSLVKNPTKNKERKVAEYLRKTYKGLGPKQSRNFIQWRGLSRYEIPIDGRIMKTMKDLGSSFAPRTISDLVVYELVQDALQEISEKLGIYPCILDACIFSSFDKETD
jgi:thermostable 8-oxoguanine DNA glycosylase